MSNISDKPTLGFWGKLRRPFFVLAPMANVTDAAFRRIIATYGKPDVTYTQFVSADGLCSPGRKVLVRDLDYDERERPIVAQLFSSQPERMRQAASLVRELGFDGVDINMGCPDRNVEKQGAGAALIKTPSLALELIAAAQDGAQGLPVSVKTRIGYKENELDSWLPQLLSTKPAAIIVHARTRKEMSRVPARWDVVADAVRLAAGSGTLLIGNGDVESITQGKERVAQSGCDGVMLGRAIFGNPWLFSGREVTNVDERIRAMVEHATLFEELLGDIKPFHIMKKHFKSYLGTFPGVRDLRAELMRSSNAADVKRIIIAWKEIHTAATYE